MKTQPYDPEAFARGEPAARPVDPPSRLSEDSHRDPLAHPTGELTIIVLPSVTVARLQAAAQAQNMTLAAWLDEAVAEKLKAQEP